LSGHKYATLQGYFKPEKSLKFLATLKNIWRTPKGCKCVPRVFWKAGEPLGYWCDLIILRFSSFLLRKKTGNWENVRTCTCMHDIYRLQPNVHHEWPRNMVHVSADTSAHLMQTLALWILNAGTKADYSLIMTPNTKSTRSNNLDSNLVRDWTKLTERQFGDRGQNAWWCLLFGQWHGILNCPSVSVNEKRAMTRACCLLSEDVGGLKMHLPCPYWRSSSGVLFCQFNGTTPGMEKWKYW
jgi:hypothetical protein